MIDYAELAADDLEQAKALHAKAPEWTFTGYGSDYAGIQDPKRPGVRRAAPGGPKNRAPAEQLDGH